MNTTGIKKLLIVAAFFATCGTLGAADYYVDAGEKGNDTTGDGTAERPWKTLAKAMEGRVAQDVVHAAEGVYNEGTMTASGDTLPSRVSIPANVWLIGAGAGKSVIEGQYSTDAAASVGCGAGAMRCVRFNGQSVLKGFTLRKGRTLNASSKTDANVNYGGAGVAGKGLVADCVFEDCACTGRGIWLRDDVNAVRCKFSGAKDGGGAYQAYAGVNLISCVIYQNGAIYSYCHARNCTFMANCTVQDANSDAYDSLFIGTGTSTGNGKYYNCVSRSGFGGSTTHDPDCVPNASQPGCALDDETVYRPLETSVALLNKGKHYANATNGWSALPDWSRPFWLNEASFDFAGGDRAVGSAIDIGAGELESAVERPVDYYVDAGEKGNDTTGDGSEEKPWKTLAKAMEGLKTGDTLHAAAGVYDEGTMNVSGQVLPNRVVVPAGIKLIGAGADKSVIEGEISEANANGCGPGAVRCVYGSGMIKGFTLRNGRTLNSTSDVAGAVADDLNGAGTCDNALAVACVFSNNVAKGYGNAMYKGSAIRCLFTGNSCANDGGYFAYDNVKFYSCVISEERNAYRNNPIAYNCTFNGYAIMRGGAMAASLFLGNGSAQAHQDGTRYLRCISRTAFDSSAQTVTDCTPNAAEAQTRYDPANYRPLAGSKMIDDGGTYFAVNAQNDLKASGHPEAVEEAKFDFAGGERTLGAGIDIGAGEFDPRCYPTSSGLTVKIVEGDVGTEVSISRNYESPRYCIGFVLDGEKVLFPEGNDEYVWTKTVQDWSKCTLAPIYSNAWYVDIEKGDDGNDGFTAKRAKKTIPGALAISELTSGDVIYCAPGVYGEENGSMDDGESCSRVYLTKAGVGIESVGGAETTIILGAFADTETKCGKGAVRCVRITGNGSYVKGFTLTGGATAATDKETDDANCGGGFLGVSGYGNAYSAAIDCVITNNYCSYRGGGTRNGVIIGSYIANNTASNGVHGVCGGDLHNSVILQDAYAYVMACNSLIASTRFRPNSTEIIQRNSLIIADVDGAGGAFSNCVVKSVTGSSRVDMGGNVFDSEISLDDLDATNYRPVSEKALALLRDKGGNDSDYLQGLAYYAAFGKFLGTDYAGGRRTYNVTTDIGAGEYDWRPAFGKAISLRKGDVIDLATENVTLGAKEGVDIPAGDALAFRVAVRAEGTVSFRVLATGGCEVAVTADGEAVIPDSDGLVSVNVETGVYEFSVTVTGTGTATVSEVKVPKLGLLLMLR